MSLVMIDSEEKKEDVTKLYAEVKELDESGELWLALTRYKGVETDPRYKVWFNTQGKCVVCTTCSMWHGTFSL